MLMAKRHRHPRSRRPGRPARGFSLIELIVAFALMALVLSTVLAISARAYRQIGWSGQAAEAAQWAQSLVDEAEGRPLALGHESGQVAGGRYRWTREVKEYTGPDGLMVAADGRALLWQTALEVHWHDGQRDQVIRLMGLRPPSPPRLAAGESGGMGGKASEAIR